MIGSGNQADLPRLPEVRRPGATARSLALILALSVLPFSSILADDRTNELIERIDRPDTVALAPETRAQINELLSRMDRATPRQRNQIRLIQARNLALGGDYQQGLEILTLLLEEEMPPDQHLRTLELLANMLLQTDQYHDAFRRLQAAIGLADEVDLPGHQGRVLSLAAYWYAELGASEQSREMALRTETLVELMDDDWEECITLEKLGLAWMSLSEYARAMRLAQRALKACEAAGDRIFASAILLIWGELLRRLAYHEQAEAKLLRAIDIAEQHGYLDGLLHGRVIYAQLLVEMDRHAEAEELLSGTVAQVESRQRWRPLKNARYLLGQIAQAQGDHEAAYEHYLGYLEAQERYLAALRTRLNAFHEVRLGARAREQELELLREQSRLGELEERARHQQRRLQVIAYGLIVALALVLILMIVHAIRERGHYRQLSRRDSLTGLHNHTHFFQAASLAVAEARQQRASLSLLLIDVDHFKRINDTYGHLAGDEVIRRIASRLNEVFGPYGTVGRIGGEEFGVVLPGIGADKVRRLVEGLRTELGKTRQHDAGQRVTISAGVAELGPKESIIELRQRADEALYQAKDAGRNRIVIAPGPLSTSRKEED